jgi:hypothetical protein
MLAAAVPGSAETVKSGFDLLKTTQALVNFPDGMGGFTAANLIGVPLGTHDFPPLHNVGFADTIVHRLEDANAPIGMSDTIDIEMVALQLKSDGPITIAGFTDTFYFTQSSTQASLGTMDIHFASMDGGTFDSTLNIYFDIWTGGFGENLFFQNYNKTLTMTGAAWQRTNTGGIPIEGINLNLNGSNSSNDFWLSGPAFHDSGDGFTHVVSVPEPESWAMLIAGFGLVGAVMRRKAARQLAA